MDLVQVSLGNVAQFQGIVDCALPLPDFAVAVGIRTDAPYRAVAEGKLDDVFMIAAPAVLAPSRTPVKLAAQVPVGQERLRDVMREVRRRIDGFAVGPKGAPPLAFVALRLDGALPE
jgi:hypothetical protein